MVQHEFYTYAWIREDGTPYYIGKGKGDRYKSARKRRLPPPPPDRILILKKNLTEKEAFRHECYMIFLFGRKDNGTGVLRNLTNGGEGTSGRVIPKEERLRISVKVSASLIGNTRRRGKTESKETRRRKSESHIGLKSSQETCEKISSALSGVPKTEEHKQNLRGVKVGYKCWVNQHGSIKVQPDCPGEGWIRGRVWRNPNDQ